MNENLSPKKMLTEDQMDYLIENAAAHEGQLIEIQEVDIYINDLKTDLLKEFKKVQQLENKKNDISLNQNNNTDEFENKEISDIDNQIKIIEKNISSLQKQLKLREQYKTNLIKKN